MQDRHATHRDATMILIAYRHSLRAWELTDLRWDQVEFTSATLHVRRVKQGTPSTHPILGDELRALRRLQREQKPKSPFVFTSERDTPFTRQGSHAWWSVPVSRQDWASKLTRIWFTTSPPR
jgi:integrase